MEEFKDIKAYYRREERYEGLQIVFFNKERDSIRIEKIIEDAKKECGVDPKVYENCYKDEPDKCAFYIEFEDDYDKIAGEFFEQVLCKLGITKCS